MSTSIITIEFIRTMTNNGLRQSACIDLFQTALQNEDLNTLISVTEYVAMEEHPWKNSFSRSWQMHCLGWLTTHYLKTWRNLPNDAPEEKNILSDLLRCIWRWKWLVCTLPQDLSESMEDIKQTTQFMFDLYNDFNIDLSMVYKAITEQHIIMGNRADAEIAFHKWQEAVAAAGDTDFNRDCDACEQSGLIQYHHFMGHDDTVLRLAEPILSNQMSCREVPHVCYEYIISSMIQLGKIDDATTLLNDAIDCIAQDNHSFLYIMPRLIQLAARLGNHELVGELLDDFDEDIIDAIQNNHFDYLHYLIAIAPYNQDAQIAAYSLAQQFDNRNGNRYYQNKLDLMLVKSTLPH